MKKFFLSFASLSVMVAMACLLAVSVSSCGDNDNDGPGTPSSNPGTYAIAQYGVFTTASTLRNFTVYLEDENGTRTQLTTENTKPVSALTFGDAAKLKGNEFQSVMKVSTVSDEFRFYEGTATKHTTFPVSYKKKVIVVANETTEEKSNLFVMPDIKIDTDAEGFGGAKLNILLAFSSGLRMENWKTRYSGAAYSMDLTFNSPSDISGSVVGATTKKAE